MSAFILILVYLDAYIYDTIVIGAEYFFHFFLTTLTLSLSLSVHYPLPLALPCPSTVGN